MIESDKLTPEAFWDNVDYKRRLNNISWNELMRRLDIDERNLHNTRKGLPCLRTAMRLAEILDCDINALLIG